MLGRMRRLRVAAAVVALAGCKSPSSGTADKHATPPTAPSAAAATAAPVPPKAGLVEGAVVRPHREEPVVECPAKIPDNADDETRVQALIEEANKQIDQAA